MTFIPEVAFTYFDDACRSYNIASVFNEVMVNNIIVANFEKPITYKGKSSMFSIFLGGEYQGCHRGFRESDDNFQQ